MLEDFKRVAGFIQNTFTTPFSDLAHIPRMMGYGSSVRLGITGLARSGKTVFITSLVANMLAGQRMSHLRAQAQNRVQSVFLQPQPDDTVPRFAYEENLDILNASPSQWPSSTRAMSQLRLSLRLHPTSMFSGVLGDRIKHIDLVDYPGEWILDLGLLEKTYKDWCYSVLQKMEKRAYAKEYLSFMRTLESSAEFDELVAQKTAEVFRKYLTLARQNGVSDLSPGRFFLVGELEGSPVLTFAPIPMPDTPKRKSLWSEMSRRFEAYKTSVVRPFFRDHFSKIDRQVVLVDVLSALHNGPDAVDDLRETMRDVLSAFRPGKNTVLSRLIGRTRVEKVLFAATKVDHVHQAQHPAVTGIMNALTQDAASRAEFQGAQTQSLALASLRCTTEEARDHQGQSLNCVRGTLLKDRKQVVAYAGELPDDPTDLLSESRGGEQSWLNHDFDIMQFAPPKQPYRHGQGIAHIRLDRAAEFLIGDCL